MNKLNKNIAGFTLIELMITVAIIGILAAIAYPSYTEYVLRGNRTEGQALLNDAAARQERYYAQNNTYADTPAKLGYTSTSTVNGLYVISTPTGTASAYTLLAATQRTDAKCGDLGLNQAGTKTKSGTGALADCWK
ncbi:MAG: type IV pilus assembly protein PilE [Pseudomonas sp.]|jgi:type IV pilus assembly protein PilE